MWELTHGKVSHCQIEGLLSYTGVFGGGRNNLILWLGMGVYRAPHTGSKILEISTIPVDMLCYGCLETPEAYQVLERNVFLTIYKSGSQDPVILTF